MNVNHDAKTSYFFHLQKKDMEFEYYKGGCPDHTIVNYGVLEQALNYMNQSWEHDPNACMLTIFKTVSGLWVLTVYNRKRKILHQLKQIKNGQA